jgi:hypothetical protein
VASSIASRLSSLGLSQKIHHAHRGVARAEPAIESHQFGVSRLRKGGKVIVRP